jgi:hypothetical protein
MATKNRGSRLGGFGTYDATEKYFQGHSNACFESTVSIRSKKRGSRFEGSAISQALMNLTDRRPSSSGALSSNVY